MEVILWLLQKIPLILQFISMMKSLQHITIHIQAHQLSPINSMMVELSGSTITLSQDHHQELIPSHKCMVQMMVRTGLFLMNNQISHSVQVKPNTSLFDPIQGVTIITS